MVDFEIDSAGYFFREAQLWFRILLRFGVWQVILVAVVYTTARKLLFETKNGEAKTWLLNCKIIGKIKNKHLYHFLLFAIFVLARLVFIG